MLYFIENFFVKFFCINCVLLKCSSHLKVAIMFIFNLNVHYNQKCNTYYILVKKWNNCYKTIASEYLLMQVHDCNDIGSPSIYV